MQSPNQKKNDSLIDSLAEACDNMLGILEADSQLKHSKDFYGNSREGSKMSRGWADDDTINHQGERNFYHSVRDSLKAKEARGNKEKADDYTPTRYDKPVSHSRLDGDVQARDLIAHGVSKDRVREIAKKAKDDHDEEKRELEEYRKEKKKAIKETCLYILSVVDDI